MSKHGIFKGIKPFYEMFYTYTKKLAKTGFDQKPVLFGEVCMVEDCLYICNTVAEFTSRFSPDEINTINWVLNTVLTKKYTY